jgi:hypothetical protein
MWINSDVDLPQTLITAQREGRLVVFAGAGASMGSPSDLPSFDMLADAVAGGVVAKKDREALDVFLGRVEQHGINVQARVRAIIDVPTSLPRVLHNRIVALFRGEDSVRLVTTNFDRHFTTTLRARYPNAEIFTGPALPLGRDFFGLVYLHGAAEKATSHLVLTDGDFGRAYLADGWATRFLMEMFRTYAVLFIGYSHQDPVMRYLARSFVGGTDRFALSPPGQDDHWTNLGITPVHFPMRSGADGYGAIDDALESWAKTAAMGAFDHKARITQLVESAPPIDPESIDYLRQVLADRVTLLFFVGSAKRIEWLEWTEKEGFLAPLTTPASLTADEPRLIAHWFAEQFAVPHLKEALQFAQRHAANLNAFLCSAIAQRLARSGAVTGEALRLWASALLALPNTPAPSLGRLLERCGEADEIATAAVLFRSLLRLELRFERYWSRPDFGGPLTLDVAITVRGEKHDLRRAWDRTIRPNLGSLYREVLPMVTNYLCDAYGALKAGGALNGTWDPMSHRRSAIEAHDQDRFAPDWSLLVDVGREALDWALTNDLPFARATIEAWRMATPQLLNRLAIYGTGRRTDLAPDEKLLAVEDNAWLYRFKHDTFVLLATAFPAASSHAQQRFIEYSMNARVLPEQDVDLDARRTAEYEQYNIAVGLDRVSPESAIARAHFASLQDRHRDFGPREHPDLDYWISAGFVGPSSPKTPQELLEMSPEETLTYVLTFQPEGDTFRRPDRHGLLTIFEQAATGAVNWSLEIAEEAAIRSAWAPELWAALLGAWRNASLDADAWGRVIGLIDSHPEIAASSPGPSATLLDNAMERKDIGIGDIEVLETIGERLLPTSAGREAGVHRGDGSIDWLTSAINHPAGQVALMWITALSKRMEIAGEEWSAIPTILRTRFERLLTTPGPNGELARVAFASQVHFLFKADREWTGAHVIPLFNWDADPVRATQAWAGFLVWGRWYDALFDQMLPFTRMTFARTQDLGENRDAFSSALAGVAAFTVADPWHVNGWLFDFMLTAAVELRAQWAKDFGRYIESINADGIMSLWNRWLSEYWSARITGVPRPLEDTETQAMVGWLIPLVPVLALAVERTLAAPPRSLDHFVFYRLSESGMARSHGAEVGRLLRGIMTRLTEILYDSGEVLALSMEALNHGADPRDLLSVSDDMVRMGIAGAEELRARVNSMLA